MPRFPSSRTEDSPLNVRERVFVDTYLTTWNGTEAMRRAGYGTCNAAEAYKLRKRPPIAGEIRRRLEEMRMSADEVLVRLTEQARGAYKDYLLADGTVDLTRMLAEGRGHLIKAMRVGRGGNIVVEFHDAQTALSMLARTHGLFQDKEEPTTHVQIRVNYGEAPAPSAAPEDFTEEES